MTASGCVCSLVYIESGRGVERFRTYTKIRHFIGTPNGFLSYYCQLTETSHLKQLISRNVDHSIFTMADQ